MRLLGMAVLMASGFVATPAAAGGPELIMPVTSSDQLGLSVSRKGKTRSVSAVLGMWSDDGALELGGFREGPASDVDPSVARAVQIVSGKSMRSSGVRLSGALHRSGGLSLSVEARQQRVSDVGAALAGAWRSASDSRLTLGGKLRF